MLGVTGLNGAEIAILAVLICGAAVLYTSVGHAGASGYIAAMALMGLPPDVMKPTALTLNILVATLATARWTSYGRDLAWKALLPLVLGSVPAAFIGGAFQLSEISLQNTCWPCASGCRVEVSLATTNGSGKFGHCNEHSLDAGTGKWGICWDVVRSDRHGRWHLFDTPASAVPLGRCSPGFRANGPIHPTELIGSTGRQRHRTKGSSS